MSPRTYTIKQACEALSLPRRTFYDLRKAGKLPMLDELRPRLGRVVRFRAEPIDRYLAGLFGQPRSFMSHRRTA